MDSEFARPTSQERDGRSCFLPAAFYNLEHLKARLFPDDAIISFRDTPPTALIHVVSATRLGTNGEEMDFNSPALDLTKLHADISGWYQETFRMSFNKFQLGDTKKTVQQSYCSDPRFNQACEALGIAAENRSLIDLPWWSVQGLAEKEFDRQSLTAPMAPRHSYETQLMRNGIHLPIKNASVCALVTTAPTEVSPAGKVMIGLRAGASYPNTYHVFARAFQPVSGSSIYETFLHTELKKS